MESLLNVLLASIVTMDNQPTSKNSIGKDSSLGRDLMDCIVWLPNLFVDSVLSNRTLIMTAVALGVYSLKALQKLDTKSRDALMKPCKDIATMELQLLMDGLNGIVHVEGNDEVSELWFVTGNGRFTFFFVGLN
jgi:hypothetical protein